MLSDQDSWMHISDKNGYVDRLLALNNILFRMSAKLLDDFIAAKKEVIKVVEAKPALCSCAVKVKDEVLKRKS